MYEKKFGQKLKNWKFFSFDRSSIDRMLIESGKFKKPKIFIAISIGRETNSIDRESGRVKFWKTEQANAETPQSTLFYE